MNVVILSDVRVYRDALATLLAQFATIKVVGTGACEGGARIGQRANADLVLLDTVQPHGRECARLIRRARPRTKIVALGVREIESDVLACAAAGIDGYIRIEATGAELVAVLESVMRDELICSRKLAASLYHSAGLLRAESSDQLTRREIQVVELMNGGLSNKEIAQHLGIEASTAKNHVQNILAKLQVHRRGQAVAKVRSLIRRRLGAGGTAQPEAD